MVDAIMLFCNQHYFTIGIALCAAALVTIFCLFWFADERLGYDTITALLWGVVLSLGLIGLWPLILGVTVALVAVVGVVVAFQELPDYLREWQKGHIERRKNKKAAKQLKKTTYYS